MFLELGGHVRMDDCVLMFVQFFATCMISEGVSYVTSVHVSAFSKHACCLESVFRFFASSVHFSHISKNLIRASPPNVTPVQVSVFFQAKATIDFRVARRTSGSLFRGHFHHWKMMRSLVFQMVVL